MHNDFRIKSRLVEQLEGSPCMFDHSPTIMFMINRRKYANIHKFVVLTSKEVWAGDDNHSHNLKMIG